MHTLRSLEILLFLNLYSIARIEAPRAEIEAPKADDMPFYAVARGHRPGVYIWWDDAKAQVERFPSPRYQKFAFLGEACAFLRESGAPIEDAFWYFENAAGACEEDFRRVNQGGFYDQQGFYDLQAGDASTLVAFTDGSALSNGTPNARAGWACVFPHNRDWDRAAPLAGELQTNNRAEYRAAIEAILRANVEDPGKVKPLYIYTDSMLLIKSMMDWISGWRARGWIKADGAPVLNVDLLQWLLREKGERRIIWTHVPAHTDGSDWHSQWNDLADRMAKEQARR